MKKYTLLLLICALCSIVAPARDYNNESLDYKVMFKWGLINKQAGHCNLSIHSKGDQYHSILTAASEPWADKIYKVRDTLIGVMDQKGMVPTYYEKISHEGNEDKHDKVEYVRSKTSAATKANCTRVEWKKGKLKKDEKRTLEAYGTTVDMLSSFYYMRELPYEKWQPGHVITINIFSGKCKELLTIKYLGTEKISYDNRSYDTYHISFIFTSDGRTKTSDDMDAWITADARRLPVKLEGQLPVGVVRCFYTGK